MNTTGETTPSFKKCKNCRMSVSAGNSLSCGSCNEVIHYGCTEHSYDKATLDRMNRPHSEVYYMCGDCRYYFRNAGQRIIAISRKMNRLAMRHRTGLIMLAATFFPVLEMISDIQPFQTGVEQIDDAIRRISNAVSHEGNFRDQSETYCNFG